MAGGCVAAAVTLKVPSAGATTARAGSFDDPPSRVPRRHVDLRVALRRVARQIADAEANVDRAGRVLRVRGYHDTSPVWMESLVVTYRGWRLKLLARRRRAQAIVQQQAVHLEVRLLDAEAGGDPAVVAATRGQLHSSAARIDDDDELGRMRPLRTDLPRAVQRADIEPVFAVHAGAGRGSSPFGCAFIQGRLSQ